MRALSLLLAFCAAGLVSAHGFLNSLTINGMAYIGNKPSENSSDPIQSIIRQVKTQRPNTNASNPAVNCGPEALAASQVAEANPGDSLTFSWKQVNNSNWPHVLGPMMTYMASCGSSTCDKFDATRARWFKINQVGRKDGSANWAQWDVAQGRADNVTIPPTLASGNYLVRHECINLQLANSIAMAEFYPACLQFRIGGNQSGHPNDNELVSLPGAYSNDDQGLYNPIGFNNPEVPYVFPGPPVAAFVFSSETNDITTPRTSRSSRCTAYSPFLTFSNLLMFGMVWQMLGF